MKSKSALSIALAGACMFVPGSTGLAALLYNPIVTQVGNGSTPASGVGYTTSIVMYENTTANQAAPLGSVAFNSGASGTRLVLSASATSEGNLSNSPTLTGNAARGLPTTTDAYAYVAGYDAAEGTATVNGTTANANRVVGRVTVGSLGLSGVSTPQTQPQATNYNNNNFRSATGNDAGTDFWTGGTGTAANAGWRYFNTPTQVSATVTNTRAVEILNGQLFGSTGSGSIGIYAVGSGIPTTSGNTATNLFPITGGSPYEFAMFDDPNNSASTTSTFGFDTIYVADDRAVASNGGIEKWVWDGTAWSNVYTLSDGLLGARGLAGQMDAQTGLVTLWTTSGAATSTANKLYQVTDVGASSSFITLATAPTNTVFRGVALAPIVPEPAGLALTAGLLPLLRRRRR